jgi:hypothetical protein
VPTDLTEWKSFALQQRVTNAELEERDTQYFANVHVLMGCWNEAMGQASPMLRGHYVKIRTLLKENAMTCDDVTAAIHAYARDPYWGKTATGFDQFFNNPVRVQDFIGKSKKHDRFARNLPPADSEGGSYEF